MPKLGAWQLIGGKRWGGLEDIFICLENYLQIVQGQTGNHIFVVPVRKCLHSLDWCFF